MRHIAAFLRSVLFALIFYPVSVLYVVAAFAMIFVSAPLMRRIAHHWAGFHRSCARWLLGVKVEIIGAPQAAPALYAIKHESMFETIEVPLVFAEPAVVAKRELQHIPLWGQIATHYGMIFIDRDGGAATLRSMMQAVRGFVADGRSIVIFPEGTRTPHGVHAPLQSGFAGLYKIAKLPVIPVAVDSGRLMRKGRFTRYPGTVTVRFCDPIPPGLDRETIETRVHAAINMLNRKAGAN